jgi:hypothetical protein
MMCGPFSCFFSSIVWQMCQKNRSEISSKDSMVLAIGRFEDLQK